MRFFLDSEFIEDGSTIKPLSIALVAEDGRELIVYCGWTDPNLADAWVTLNVFPHLPLIKNVNSREWDWKAEAVPVHVARKAILEFIGSEIPEFWGYYADYDWVLLCQLFCRMIDLPKGWPMFCLDLRQTRHMMGDTLWNEMVPKQDEATTHDALADARWIKTAYEATAFNGTKGA